MRTSKAGFTIGLALAALFAQDMAFAHGGGLDSDGGHADDRTGEYHKHGGADADAKDEAGGCSERPDYDPKLDVRQK